MIQRRHFTLHPKCSH